MRFDRNPDYWKKGEPYLERIVARFIADYSTRSAVIETGDAHIAGFGAVPYSDVNRLKELPDIDVTLKGYEMQSPLVELEFNTTKPPFDNKKVRRSEEHTSELKSL